MNKLFVLILFFCLPVFAQSNITVYSGVTTDNIFNFTFFPDVSYKTGTNLGISANFKAVGLINFSPSFEYTSYKFKEFSPGAMLQQFGLNYISSDGDNLTNIKLGADIKLIKYDNAPLRFFIYSGASYLIENYGSFKEIWKEQNGNNNTESVSLGRHYCFVHDFGLGIAVKVYENYGISINGQYYSDYKNIFRYSANAGIVYNFAH